MRILILLFVSIFAFNANASESFFYANKGEVFFEGSLNYFNSNANGSLVDESELQDIKAQVQIEYGLFDFVSVYGSLSAGYGEDTETVLGVESTTRFKAIDNINVGAKSKVGFGHGNVLSAVNIGIGAFENNGKNRTYGNYAATLRLGYELNVKEELLVGVLLTQGVYSTDARFPGTTEVKLRGSSILSVFTEYDLNSKSKLIFDLRYGLETSPLGVFNSIGSAGSFLADGGSDNSGYGLKAAYKYSIGDDESFSVIPSLSFEQIEYGSTDTDTITGNVTFRVKL